MSGLLDGAAIYINLHKRRVTQHALPDGMLLSTINMLHDIYQSVK